MMDYTYKIIGNNYKSFRYNLLFVAVYLFKQKSESVVRIINDLSNLTKLYFAIIYIIICAPKNNFISK